MSASGVKQGNVYIEIGADPRKFFAAVNRVNARLGQMGRNLSSAGSSVAGFGLAFAAPFAGAVMAGTKFQNVLLNIGASTGQTAAQLESVRAASMSMSQSLGVGPTEAAQGMLELLKAGMSLQDVLGGAGKSAIEFARVGNIDVATAAVVMSDAMNVFGVSASEAANTMSAAADASSTSIEGMTQAFSMSSAVAALANQSIGDLSAALAILANAGVKGSDAGTSIKTMLLRLMAPTDDAIGGMNQLGLSVQSFRGADGKILPMVEIIRVLNGQLKNLDKTAQDDVLRKIFGSDAIRAAAILTSSGVEGFEKMQDSMKQALPVGEKFKMLMSGMMGAGVALMGALERLAIATSDALGPAIAKVVPIIAGFIDGITAFVTKNPKTIALIASIAAGAVGVGAAMVVAGTGISLASSAIGFLIGVAGAVVSPIAAIGGAALFVGGSFASVVPGLIGGANAAGSALVALGSTAASSMTLVGTSVVRAMTAAGSAVVGFAASALSPLMGFGGSLRGVFVSQFAIARFVGKGMTSAIVTAFGKMLMSFAPLRSAFLMLAPLATAIGRDVVRAFAPIASAVAPAVAGLVGMTQAAGAWAAATATAAGRYIASTAAAVAATVAAQARMVAAWAGQMIAPVVAWATATATAVGRYVASMATATAATVGNAARMAGAWIATLIPSTAAWAASSAAAVGRYIASTVAAAAATVANAGRIAVAWVAGGLPGLGAFVAGSVAAIGTYLGAAAAAVAGSIASAVAISAAWLAPLSPILAIGAAIALAAGIAYQFGGAITGALSGIGSMATAAGSAIGETFNAVVADASVVFADLWSTATTTFAGIRDAIANGDLAGAMDVLWAGLQAGWLRGVEALMGYVDPWVAMFQNTFTYLGTTIAQTWDALWTGVSATFNVFGAVLMGAFDNIINPILAMWDTLEAGVRKAWIRISGIFKDAKDRKAALEGVDAEMKGRAEKRAKERPGMGGRVAQANEQNAKEAKASEQRRRAMGENADQIAQGRLDQNAQNAEARRAATVAAEDRVASLSQQQTETRQGRNTGNTLIDQLDTASSMDELRTISEQIHDLHTRGILSDEQYSQYQSKVDASAERIQEAESGKPTTADATREAANRGAQDAEKSKAEVMGTFSGAGLGGLGFGLSLAERQAKASEETAAGVKQLVKQGSEGVGA
jgi:TP901 family phage tail tape measure protein